MGVVAGVAQCCAGREPAYDEGPRDAERKAAFPNSPPTARGLPSEGSDLPAGAPIFHGQAPEVAPPVADLGAPPSKPAAASEAPAPVAAPAPTPVAAPAPTPVAAPKPVAVPEPLAPAKPSPAVKPPAEPAVPEPPALSEAEVPKQEEKAAAPPATEEPEKEEDHRGETDAFFDDDEVGPSILTESKEPAKAPEASKSSEPEEELPPAGPAAVTKARAKVWKVVGGDAEKGGIVVRKGEGLKTKMLTRLSTGATVEELETKGERLHYKRLTGAGPLEGWVSLTTKGKDLLVAV